jgi:hypothetical protein
MGNNFTFLEDGNSLDSSAGKKVKPIESGQSHDQLTIHRSSATSRPTRELQICN